MRKCFCSIYVTQKVFKPFAINARKTQRKTSLRDFTTLFLRWDPTRCHHRHCFHNNRRYQTLLFPDSQLLLLLWLVTKVFSLSFTCSLVVAMAFPDKSRDDIMHQQWRDDKREASRRILFSFWRDRRRSSAWTIVSTECNSKPSTRRCINKRSAAFYISSFSYQSVFLKMQQENNKVYFPVFLLLSKTI